MQYIVFQMIATVEANFVLRPVVVSQRSGTSSKSRGVAVEIVTAPVAGLPRTQQQWWTQPWFMHLGCAHCLSNLGRFLAGNRAVASSVEPPGLKSLFLVVLIGLDVRGSSLRLEGRIAS